MRFLMFCLVLLLASCGAAPSVATTALSATATRPATATIAPTFTPGPTPVPATAPPATVSPRLFVTFLTIEAGRVRIQTQPGATITHIAVVYPCSGKASTAEALKGSTTADPSGIASWSWTATTSCSTAQATLTVTWQGQTATYTSP